MVIDGYDRTLSKTVKGAEMKLGDLVFLNGNKYFVAHIGERYCLLSNRVDKPIMIKKNKLEKLQNIVLAERSRE